MRTSEPGVPRLADKPPAVSEGRVLRMGAFLSLLGAGGFLLGLALAGCSSEQAKEEEKWKDTSVAIVSKKLQADDVSAAAAAPKTVGPPFRAYEMDKDQKAMWSDPAFKRQFSESYLASTEVDPTSKLTTPERKQMQQVLKLMADNNPSAAATMVAQCRGADANPVFDFLAGNFYYEREQFDNAVDAYKVAVAKHDRFLRAWRNLGLVYIHQKDYDRAIPVLTKVMELGGADGNTYGLLAYSYSTSTFPNHVGAETAYRMAILLDPKTLDWKMGLARSFYRQGRYGEAVAALDRLIAEHPDRAELWQLQAVAYLKQNQPMKAAENYEVLDRMGKATADSLVTLGNVYVNAEIYDHAVAYFIRALDMDGKTTSRALTAARVLAGRGANKEAKTLAEHIETVRGDQLALSEKKDLLRLRNRIAAAEGSGPEAARALQDLIALDPTDGDALIQLGQYHGRSGETEKAVFCFERAEKIKAYEAEACLRHAELLVKLKKYAEAVPLLEQSQRVNPRDKVEEYLKSVKRAAKLG